MKTAIYLRISTEMQSTESQEVAIQNYCATKGYDKEEILSFKDEGISGGTLDRPGFKALMQAVKDKKITRLITYEISRLSRDFRDGFLLMKELSDAGVVVETPNEGVIHMSSEIDQFIVIAKSLVAAQERSKIKERVKAGLVAAKARGVVLGAPKGNTYTKGRRKEYDKALIAKVMRLRAKGHTFRDIASVTEVSHTTIATILRRHTKKKLTMKEGIA